jgi:hypothetical protein
VNGVAGQDTGSAKYHLSVHGVPHFFGRERHVMRPFALEITAGDFAFAAGHLHSPIGLCRHVRHTGASLTQQANAGSGGGAPPLPHQARRITISIVGACSNFLAAFSIASRWSAASISPSLMDFGKAG